MEPNRLRISIFIPCYNEEGSIRQSIESWLAQTRPADEIIVVDDCSTDGTARILDEYSDRILVVRTPKNSGNKSYAQEYGLQFVTGDVFATTDGDTLLHPDFLKYVEQDFEDPDVAALGGYVKSLPYNWLTACRALDYAIGQNIDKMAQDTMNFIFVIPGAAGAFRTSVFKQKIAFTHDTLTEDLDFTYRLHKMGYQIKYDRRAICYTQDPATLRSYINQTRRWLCGGWQNLMKHVQQIPTAPGMALELTLIYLEGLVFSVVLFILPFLNFPFAFVAIYLYLLLAFILASIAARIERRPEFLLVLPLYIFLKYVNAYVFLEQFVKEVILKRRNLVWYKPERVKL